MSNLMKWKDVIAPGNLNKLEIGNHQFTTIEGIQDEEVGPNAKRVVIRENNNLSVNDSFTIYYRRIQSVKGNFGFEISTENFRIEILPDRGQLNIYFNIEGDKRSKADPKFEVPEFLSKDSIYSSYVLHNIFYYAMKTCLGVDPLEGSHELGINIAEVRNLYLQTRTFRTYVNGSPVSYKLTSFEEGSCSFVPDSMNNLTRQDKLMGLSGAMIQICGLIKFILYAYQQEGKIED